VFEGENKYHRYVFDENRLQKDAMKVILMNPIYNFGSINIVTIA
jgi:hypothetical protein